VTVTTALYRRYRPDSFADVIGQEHVTEPLMTALRKNRVNHAYLFSGPRGCGKTTSARILARCLNCAKGPTDTPCGTCPSCVELARGGSGSLDVIEIDAASHGGVDDARDLRERATYAPVRDRYKIFIIDEAHMVTSAGFNALLKIVEEPPEHIKFIFATTEPDKVIGTIRSRTHHYPFRLVPPEPLMAYLELLCNQENVPVAPGVLSLVIRAGGGSVRDSLSVLDQLMAGAGPNGLDYELAVALLGYTHASLLDDVVEAVAASDAATVFRAVDRVIQTGHDPRRFVEDLLERFRDLIIVQAMPESAQTILRGMPADQIARLKNQAHNLGGAELSRAADVTNTALTEMTGATSPRLHLELLCARILLPSSEQNERGMAARIDRVERRLNYAGNDVGAPAADWGLATAPGGSGEPEPAPARPAETGSAPTSPGSSAVPAAGHAPASSPEASAVSAPQRSGPTITASRPDAAAPADAGSAAGASGNEPSALSQQPAPQPVATQPSAAQSAAAQQEAARGHQQQAGDYSYPDDDWGPPLDEDAPPLDEEPPMDWEPSRQWQGSPAPSSAPEIKARETKAPEVKQPAESEPPAAQTRAKTVAPAQAERQPAPDTSADPWSRAVEQTPGVWALGSESNVGKNPAAADIDDDEESTGSAAPVYPPAAAQLPHAGGDAAGGQLSSTPGGSASGEGTPGVSGPGVSGPAEIAAAERAPETAERGVPEFEPAYAMASAPAAASHEYGAPTPNQGVRAPAVTAATDAAPVRVPVFASGPVSSGRARSAGRASGPGRPLSCRCPHRCTGAGACNRDSRKGQAEPLPKALQQPGGRGRPGQGAGAEHRGTGTVRAGHPQRG
jgi:DNA polymerase-3 subunit gamma/tau